MVGWGQINKYNLNFVKHLVWYSTHPTFKSNQVVWNKQQQLQQNPKKELVIDIARMKSCIPK